jgi:hypothetical protein
LQSSPWVYLGFVEYLDGEQLTSIPWSGPDVNTRHELAARLFVEGVGFSGPSVYGVLSDLPEVFPTVLSAEYNSGALSLDVTLQPGGLTSSLGMWSRPLFVPVGPVPSPAVETGSWTYHGATGYELNTSLHQIPFDRAGSQFTLATALFIKNLGFVLPHYFASAPETDVVYPDLKSIVPDATNKTITLEFRPAGNQPTQIGIWFREFDSVGCTPLCDWTFYGFEDYELGRRDQVIEWNPGSSSSAYQVAARLYVDDGVFSGFIDSYVIYSGCLPSTPPPTLTAPPVSEGRGTPTATPTVTPYFDGFSNHEGTLDRRAE